MAEHEERNFEHEISEKLKMLDASIKIPEIPDAQGIFEKAAEKKPNVIPFRKYTKYIAAAAAVVLICISVPVMADVLSGKIGMANEDAMMEREYNGFSAFDSLADKETDEAVTEAPNEPETAYIEESDFVVSSSSSSSSGEQNETEICFTDNAEEVREALYNFFWSDLKTELTSSGSSSDFRIEENPIKEHSTANAPSGNISYGDDVSFIEDYINKKRTVELTLEKDSVSVLLRDNSSEEEMINAFWIEGTYEGSYVDGDYYVINLLYSIDANDLEKGYYLPVVGDAYGTYYISEKDIFVPEKITKGAIALAVEINIGTGEYRIYASLV